jgi:putative ABC transport system permease protein
MRWYQRFFRRGQTEKHLDAELRFHLEQQIADYVAAGMKPEEARRQARLEFGGLDQVKEECRDVGAAHVLETLAQDVRYGLRQLRRNPSFTAVAVLTLALGIGANTAIFGVLNAVLLRPLPYKSPDQLVQIWETDLKSKTSQGPASYPNFLDWRAQNHVFQSVAAYNWATFTLRGSEEPIHVEGLIVSADLFSVLGVEPVLGRAFLPEEDQPSHYAVVLSHKLWRGRFGSDPGVLGRSIRLDRMSFVVVGVMPAGFEFPIQAKPVEVWVARGLDSQVPNRDSHYFGVLGRLRSRVTLEQAKAEMTTIAARLAREYPNSNKDSGVKLVPEYEELVGDVRPAMLILFGAVVLVLLIACADLANLLLARATHREREIAVRAALGAGPRRILRQLLTECLLLSALSGPLGLFLAWWGIRLLVRLGPNDIPRLAETRFDAHVLAFTVDAILATALIFGLVPALRTAKTDLVESLKEAGRAFETGSQHYSLRAALIVSEVALTLILLTGSGLLINSLFKLTRIDPGFNPHGVLTFAVDLSDANYTDAQAATTFSQLLERIRHTPGVDGAAADTSVPLSDVDITYCGFQIEAQTGSKWHEAAFSVVTPDFFHTLGIPLLEGRDFNAADDLKALPVVIVSQSLARKFFPGQNAVGKRIKSGFNATDEMPMREIIGVVGDMRRDNLTDKPQPAFYLSEGQVPFDHMRFVVRSAVSPSGLVDTMRATVWSVNRNLPVYDIRTLEQYVGIALGHPRFNTLLLGLFAGLAVVLSTVGLYGTISYAVSQRTHEFGVRLALGAMRHDLVTMVLGQGLVLALIGIALGLAGALALTRFLSSLLYGVKPTDPLTFVAVSLILTAVALLACYIPARRATKVDPMVALRYE